MHRQVYSDALSCPPQVVWAFLADLRNDKLWRFEVTRVDLVTGTPPDAPATYREYLEWAGFRADVLLTVRESIPGSKLVVDVNAPGFSSQSEWTFEPREDGSIVTLNFSLEATMAMGMTEPVIWKLADAWLSRDLPLLVGHLACA